MDTGVKTTGGNHNKTLPFSQSSQDTASAVNTTLTVVQERTPPRATLDMRPLSPIKPLSPIGF
jgi:hypothetical protein